MWKSGLILLSLVLLCAFDQAPPYDISAIPDAAAARERLLNACQLRAATFKTDRARVACGLAAHRAYAVTEKLRDMGLFRAYAAQLSGIAGDVDAGRIDQAEAYRRSSAARAQYQDTIDKQYAAWRTQRAQKGPPFDRAALAMATAARDQAVKKCGPWADIKSALSRTACILTGEKAFVTAIRLQDIDLFYGYASVLRVDAVDAEDGKRAVATMDLQHQTLWSDFLKTLNQDYTGWQARQGKTGGR